MNSLTNPAQHIADFASTLNIQVNNHQLFIEALTHRSYLNETDSSLDIRHNERLEFLGDAVLELLTTQFLFHKYQDRPEGELTSFRAALVRTESLAEEASRLNVGQYILMSKGEDRTGGRNRPYILANTFEAILGAMYLDSGLDTCDSFLQANLFHKTNTIVDNRLDVDSKSKLQEIAQELLKATPVYELKEASGPDHNKKFVMVVSMDGVVFGEGSGRSKQDAEQKAARYALQNWDKLYQKYQNSVKISPSN